MIDFQQFLAEQGACRPAVEWVAGRPLTAELIQACPAKGWLIWLAQRLLPDHPLLAELGKDSDWFVREAVAWRISVDHPLFLALGKDSEWHVRSAVARRRLKEASK